MSLTIATQVFLSTIAFAEGTHDRYDLTYDKHVILLFDRHPALIVRGLPYYSSAAGRYQFLYKTYKDLQKRCNIKDFLPQSQDKAAICLLDHRRVNHSVEHKTKQELHVEVKKIANVWASLPGSPYGQPTHSMEKIWQFYKKEVNKLNGKDMPIMRRN